MTTIVKQLCARFECSTFWKTPISIYYTFKKKKTLIYPTFNLNLYLTLFYIYLFINKRWVGW
jgi:hypothetical protein